MAGLEATVRLSDGRSLAYEQFGEPSGTPVLYFHGCPGSRIDWDNRVGEEALAGSGVRLVAIDRPGFGLSDRNARRRFEDWPADVERLADALGLGRFAVLGYSAGAPYVAACARAIPQRLSFAGIVSGVGPAETPNFRRGMARTDRLMTRLARFARPLARLGVTQARRKAERTPEAFSAEFDKELSQPDRELHAQPEFREIFRGIFLEATRGGPDGLVDEYALDGRRWGFSYEDVRFPVRIWHGDRDEIVPLHHAQYVAGRLANAELTIWSGVGHLHTPMRWHEVVSMATSTTKASA